MREIDRGHVLRGKHSRVRETQAALLLHCAHVSMGSCGLVSLRSVSVGQGDSWGGSQLLTRPPSHALHDHLSARLSTFPFLLSSARGVSPAIHIARNGPGARPHCRCRKMDIFLSKQLVNQYRRLPGLGQGLVRSSRNVMDPQFPAMKP